MKGFLEKEMEKGPGEKGITGNHQKFQVYKKLLDLKKIPTSWKKFLAYLIGKTSGILLPLMAKRPKSLL